MLFSFKPIRGTPIWLARALESFPDQITKAKRQIQIRDENDELPTELGIRLMKEAGSEISAEFIYVDEMFRLISFISSQ
jgi:hypothetical protein